MITDEDPLRGLLFCQGLGFSLTLHVLKERSRRYEHPHLRGKGSPEAAGSQRGERHTLVSDAAVLVRRVYPHSLFDGQIDGRVYPDGAEHRPALAREAHQGAFRERVLY